MNKQSKDCKCVLCIVARQSFFSAILRKLFLIIYLFSSVEATSQNYFQQEVNYHIQVKLDDLKNELFGDESIEYTNNSTQSLHEIYFHLWPNAYKNDQTNLAKQMLENGETSFYYSKPDDRGYIDGLKFEVNNAPANFIFDSLQIDIGKLLLNAPLLPGEKIIIRTPFHVKIPSAEFSRLGHLGQSYMITQWYPKPAVFDGLGWHLLPYLSEGEFYSEFGNFDVAVTLPKNYVVGASGVLMDTTEQKWIDEKAAATKKMEEFDTKNLTFPNSDTAFKTIHYRAQQVHDFAWFADKRFHILKSEINLPLTHRKINTYSLFTNAEAAYWKKGNEYIEEALVNYSKWLGEYPYEQVTLVDGTIAAGTGMEYPMVTVIGSSYSLYDFEYTVVHEVGHNWFYGILGSNERDHPWLDEGLNTYYNLRLFEEKYPTRSFIENLMDERYVRFAHLKKYSPKTEYILGYLGNARENKDQACTSTSMELTDVNYGNDIYNKTGFIFNYLAHYLGESLFDSIMRNYYETWKFKHPQPNDFKMVFEKGTTKNLNWFFDDMLGSTKKMDYKIASIHKKDSLFILQIKNKGRIDAPFELTAIKNNKAIRSQWYEGFKHFEKVNFPSGDYSFIELDRPWNSPEINRKNNVIRTHGILKKVEPLQFQLLASIENSEKTTINYFPVVGYNSSDKFMAGIAFYNSSILQKRFEYLFLPMYAFETKELNGAAQVYFHFHPSGIIQAIDPTVSVKKYSYRDTPFPLGFMKFSPELQITFRKKYARSLILQKVKIRNATIWEDTAPYSKTELAYKKNKYGNNYVLNSITYVLKNNRRINPCEFSFQIEQGKNYAKSLMEAIYQFSYEKNNKRASIRIFGGKFIFEKNTPSLFGFSMNGNNDYAYDNIYLGRNDVEGVFNQQFYMKDAGFKNLTLTPNSLDWMLATNIFIPAPGKIPFAFYTDIGKAANAKNIDYDFGVALVLMRNILEVYAPIQQSSDLNQLKYAEKIRFVLHFNALNPINQLKTYFN